MAGSAAPQRVRGQQQEERGAPWRRAAHALDRSVGTFRFRERCVDCTASGRAMGCRRCPGRCRDRSGQHAAGCDRQDVSKTDGPTHNASTPACLLQRCRLLEPSCEYGHMHYSGSVPVTLAPACSLAATTGSTASPADGLSRPSSGPPHARISQRPGPAAAVSASALLAATAAAAAGLLGAGGRQLQRKRPQPTRTVVAEHPLPRLLAVALKHLLRQLSNEVLGAASQGVQLVPAGGQQARSLGQR